MSRRYGAARWLLVAFAFALGCESPAGSVDLQPGPPLDPVGAITSGRFHAALSGSWTDTIDGFAEFGVVTSVSLAGRRRMFQVVAVSADSVQPDRVVFEHDDVAGFPVGIRKVGSGFKVHVIRELGTDTLYVSTGFLTITEASPDVLAGSFAFSLSGLNPSTEGSMDGSFRAERHRGSQ
jgi:hypothetical protein